MDIKPAVTASTVNLFANDGSFLDQFRKISNKSTRQEDKESSRNSTSTSYDRDHRSDRKWESRDWDSRKDHRRKQDSRWGGSSKNSADRRHNSSSSSPSPTRRRATSPSSSNYHHQKGYMSQSAQIPALMTQPIMPVPLNVPPPSIRPAAMVNANVPPPNYSPLKSVPEANSAKLMQLPPPPLMQMQPTQQQPLMMPNVPPPNVNPSPAAGQVMAPPHQMMGPLTNTCVMVTVSSANMSVAPPQIIQQSATAVVPPPNISVPPPTIIQQRVMTATSYPLPPPAIRQPPPQVAQHQGSNSMHAVNAMPVEQQQLGMICA